jgi:osmotically-inducible protein OsmY
MAVIEVISRRGLLTLKGKVDSVEISQAAEEIAQERPGVISVTNALEIEPGEFAEHLNPWLVTRPYRKKM